WTRGRQHDYATARPDAVPVQRPNAGPQGKRGHACAADRTAALEAADPGAVPEPDLPERRSVRCRGDVRAPVQEAGARPHAAGIGLDCRSDSGAFRIVALDEL